MNKNINKNINENINENTTIFQDDITSQEQYPEIYVSINTQNIEHTFQIPITMANKTGNDISAYLNISYLLPNTEQTQKRLGKLTDDEKSTINVTKSTEKLLKIDVKKQNCYTGYIPWQLRQRETFNATGHYIPTIIRKIIYGQYYNTQTQQLHKYIDYDNGAILPLKIFLKITKYITMLLHNTIINTNTLGKVYTYQPTKNSYYPDTWTHNIDNNWKIHKNGE